MCILILQQPHTKREKCGIVHLLAHIKTGMWSTRTKIKNFINFINVLMYSFFHFEFSMNYKCLCMSSSLRHRFQIAFELCSNKHVVLSIPSQFILSCQVMSNNPIQISYMILCAFMGSGRFFALWCLSGAWRRLS